ncbi:MAG: helix-turn-helix domain-containing protein [Kiloniellales bacterium]
MSLMSRMPETVSSSIAFAPCRRAEGSAIDGLFATRGQHRSLDRGVTLVLHGSPVEQVYQVTSGFLRCCTFTEEGRRQIFAFAGPGDLLGFPDLDSWHFTAEAVGAAAVSFLRAEIFNAALRSDIDFASDLRRHCVREFERRERHLGWLSHMQSEERLLAFLKSLAARSPQSDGFTDLPMTRQDLGDHLGMTFETVSRSLSALKRHGSIRMIGVDRYSIVEQGAYCATAA